VSQCCRIHSLPMRTCVWTTAFPGDVIFSWTTVFIYYCLIFFSIFFLLDYRRRWYHGSQTEVFRMSSVECSHLTKADHRSQSGLFVKSLSMFALSRALWIKFSFLTTAMMFFKSSMRKNCVFGMKLLQKVV
jgi:hypothetical protein